jgi:hypothetical protein
MSDRPRHEEAAQLLFGLFEALARQNGKTLSPRSRERLTRACELLSGGDELEELLDDLPIQPDRVTQNFQRPPPGWEDFDRWSTQRRQEEHHG